MGNIMENKNLHTITKTGFKIPVTYFDALEDAVFSKLKEDAICAKVNSSGFKVPENYFESLDVKVLSSVNNNHGKSKIISLFNWKKVAYVTGIAASIILAISLFFTNSNNFTIEDIDTASIESYLMNEELNSYDITPYLDTANINSDNFVENTLKASDIENYLLQNSDVENLISD